MTELGGTERAAGSAPDVIRVVVADDHALFRRGLIMVLELEDGVEVVGEAEDGTEVVRLVEELAPDVVLMDVRMPKVSGIEATRAISQAVPTAKILMLTVSDDEDDLYDAIKAGANGYLLKEISIEEVAASIRAVVTGQSLISPSMASKLLSEFTALAKRADERQAMPSPRLTERELEVLKLVAQGMSNREIAAELFISENTVKNHVRNILEKLHLHSRMEAVVYAVREKLLDIH
jgi:DNA-binding NarL/FixJ family response regulator